MKNYKPLIFSVLAVFVMIAMTACGDESKTKALFEKIDKDTGIHMKYALESGDKTEVEVFIKGDKAYADVGLGGKHTITIIDGDKATAMDPQTKTAQTVELTEEQKEAARKALTMTAENVKDTADQEEFKKDTQKIDGMEYDVEIFEKDDKKATFVYNDDGELVFIIADDGTDEVTLKVEALDGDVKDSQFDIPSDYRIIKGSRSSSYSSGNTQSGSASGSSDSSDAGMPIGGDGTVVCKDGAFKFQTDKNYIAVVNGSNVDVYLEKKDSIPVFRCYKMPRVDQTADTFLDQSVETIKKNQGNKLAGEPERRTIKLHGKDVKSIRYDFSSDDGKMTFTGENFALIIGDNIYSWSSVYHKGDNVTPAQVYAAMKSFEEMR